MLQKAHRPIEPGAYGSPKEDYTWVTPLCGVQLTL